MARIVLPSRGVSSAMYLIAAPALILSQHLMVAAIFATAGWSLAPDAGFWLLPMRRLTLVASLPAWVAALAFAFSLAVAGALAMLSFGRARWAGRGYGLASLAIVPGAQFVAVLLLAAVPRRKEEPGEAPEAGIEAAHVVQGVIAGAAIIVAAVLVSALAIGAYGWGLFVMTPLTVGVAAGYIANRRKLLTAKRTAVVVLAAAALGTAALVTFALEGLLCILLAAPLGAAAALAGGALGRAMARQRQSGDRPLMSVALLPALFALEAATPPSVPIASSASIDVAAPPAAVWRALTDGTPIASGPGIVGLTGLAYPIRGRLIGSGIGAMRLGQFSTGTAVERVSAWAPGRVLAFVVLRQPPAMEEMSPYRRVHAPHVAGYFDTGKTRFDLALLPRGGTRLTIRATHVLRIDPALYWEPIARLALRMNVQRVLEDVRMKAEAEKFIAHARET